MVMWALHRRDQDGEVGSGWGGGTRMGKRDQDGEEVAGWGREIRMGRSAINKGTSALASILKGGLIASELSDLATS